MQKDQVRKQFDEMLSLKNESAMLYLKASDVWHRYGDEDTEEFLNLKRALSLYFGSQYENTATMAIFKLERLIIINQRLKDDAVLPEFQISVENVALLVRRIDDLAENTRALIAILDSPLWQKWFRRQPDTLAEDRFKSIHYYLEELVKQRHLNCSTTSVGRMMTFLQKTIIAMLNACAGIVQEVDRLMTQIAPTIPKDQMDSPVAPWVPDEKKGTNTGNDNDDPSWPFVEPAAHSAPNVATTSADLVGALQNRQMLRAISDKMDTSLNEFGYKLESKLDHLHDRVRQLETRQLPSHWRLPFGPPCPASAPVASYCRPPPVATDLRCSPPAHRPLLDDVLDDVLDYRLASADRHATQRSLLAHQCRQIHERLVSIVGLEEYMVLREDARWREDFFRFAARLLATVPQIGAELADLLQVPLPNVRQLSNYASIYELLRVWERHNCGYLDPEQLVEFLLSPSLFLGSSAETDIYALHAARKDIAERLVNKLADSVSLYRRRLIGAADDFRDYPPSPAGLA